MSVEDEARELVVDWIGQLDELDGVPDEKAEADLVQRVATALRERDDAHAEFAAEYDRVVTQRDERDAQVEALREEIGRVQQRDLWECEGHCATMEGYRSVHCRTCAMKHVFDAARAQVMALKSFVRQWANYHLLPSPVYWEQYPNDRREDRDFALEAKAATEEP